MKKELAFTLLLIGTTDLCIADVLLDPTKPSHMQSGNNSITVNPAAGETTLILNAIIHSPYSKQAIINGKPYLEGQPISNFRVLTIGKNQVVLTGLSGTKTLYVNNSNIKKDINNGF
ncbi:hypothetical protein [Paraglaciecola sp. 2405UD69-4]|uniref:hypothetical protein n=1 Tax=Paraglaciecola sp. 2405UD69-4 TaxID=3391836 RepID=UPI0039C9F641